MAGWARTKIDVNGPGPILDVGSGAFPNAAADVLCDSSIHDHVHRHGLAMVVDRPTVIADATALPFKDNAFAFVVASHLAEHVAEPVPFCAELDRVARAGYIETPSRLMDRLLHEEFHRWRVGKRNGTLTFRTKQPRGRFERALTERFYRVFYIGKDSCTRPPIPLPDNTFGSIVRQLRRLVVGALNRTAIMHTRYRFDAEHPMRCEVIPTTKPRRTFPRRRGSVRPQSRHCGDAGTCHQREH